MTDSAADAPEEVVKKSGKMPLVLGILLAFAGGGGGFFAVSSGLLPFGSASAESEESTVESGSDQHLSQQGKGGEDGTADPLKDIAFVPIDPIIVSLNYEGGLQHLQFRAQLEVNTAHRQEVETIMPRVVDVLNSYLRALEFSDLQSPMALAKLRAQMLRRIQIVTGKDRVRDLLIMDFVLN